MNRIFCQFKYWKIFGDFLDLQQALNGRAQAVLIDPESYQNMVNQIALLRSADQITASLVEMENDEGIESDVFFKKLRKKVLK